MRRVAQGVHLNMVYQRLKVAREAAGLTQEKLAELIGISGSSLNSRLSNYESGRNTPSFDIVVRIAQVLNYPESYFYTIDDDFAEAILRFYREQNNASLNPYYDAHKELSNYKTTIKEAKVMVERLSDLLQRRP